MSQNTRSTRRTHRFWPAAAAVLLAVLAVSGCGNTVQTNVEYDPNRNFTRYRTYSWQPGTAVGSATMDRNITQAIEKQLHAKGLRRVASGGDLRVAYYLSFDRRLDVYSYDYLSGPYWSGYITQRTVVREVPEGRLVVDLIDGKRRELVWRGVGTDELRDTDADDVEDLVDDVTRKMFEEYPPRR